MGDTVGPAGLPWHLSFPRTRLAAPPSRYPPAVHRLSEHTLEQRASLHVVLPTHDCRAPLRTATSLALGLGAELRASCLVAPGERLPPELRIALYGLAARGDAERAVRHLVRSAVVGAHVPVRPLPVDPDERRAFAACFGSPELPLVVGWSRGGPLPLLDRLPDVLTPWSGPIVVLLDDDGPVPTEVLGLALGGTAHPAVAATGVLLRGLERALPVFRVAATRAAEARAALRDCTPRTLVLAAMGDKDPGNLSELHELEEDGPHRLGLVFAPSGDRDERILAVLEKVRTARRPAAS